MLFDKKYDLVFGVGGACACTQNLRKNKLQFSSYPYDWLFGMSLLNRVKLLADNYEHFIDFEDLQDADRRNRSKENPCEVFYNTRNEIYFNHDFSYGKPLEETYPAVKEKYDRRIKRQFQQIMSSKKVLVVYLQSPHDREDVEEKTLIEAYEVLKNRFPEQEISLLYLFCNHDKKDYEIKNISENVARVDFDYDAYDEKDPFSVNEDALMRIFCKVKITNKFLTVKNYWRRFFYRVKCFYKGIK